jgi:hypothetical protein
MRRIDLNKGHIELPETWSELNKSERKLAFHLLSMLFAGEITPLQFQYAMLCKVTGFKPKRRSRTVRHLVWIFFWLFRSRNAYWQYRRNYLITLRNVQFNLFRLSEQFTFAFTLDALKIIPKFEFSSNPFPNLFKHKPSFNVGLTVETNITARQFSNCLDLAIAYRTVEKESDRIHLLHKLIATLYLTTEIHAAQLSPVVKFGVFCWFTSIVTFWKEHPVFSILFPKDEHSVDEDKISLGMSETILYLQKEGFSNASEMPLDDFFTAQVKALKDSVNQAIASGLTADKIAAQTGLPISTINRLTR